MITLKEWMELVEFKITEGSYYYTNVEGLFSLHRWDGDQDGFSCSVVFDPSDNQRVYAVEVCDYKNNRAYRLRDPLLIQDMRAWDNTEWVELESDEDFMQKAAAIRDGEDYDTRIVIPLELPEKYCYNLMRMAHERDMTFNDFIAMVVDDYAKQILYKEEN
jgi:hypothetical protein